VFYSGGPNTLAYAEELRQLFAESWKTNEVSVVPVGDERIIDVQITVGNKGQEVEARTLFDALRSAGIKHKKFFSFDPLLLQLRVFPFGFVQDVDVGIVRAGRPTRRNRSWNRRSSRKPSMLGSI
jgi:hypothetical protein